MSSSAPRQSVTVTDNRTGKTIEVPIQNGTIKALDLRVLKTSPEDFGLMTYDPAFMNTASCKSKITFIDGDKGILEYRGYPIAELAEKTTYLETAYLVLNGELPTKQQQTDWVQRHHVSHDGPREHQGPDGGLPVRRAPHGDARVHGRRAVHVLSGSQGRSSSPRPGGSRSCA